jgi:hypothetical protein
MADTDEREPGAIPIMAGLVYPVAPVFFILQREEDDKRQNAEHTGYEQQEGIDAIKPPNGFDQLTHSNRIQVFAGQWTKIGNNQAG